jgi:microcystin degradation protein MlrC
MPKRVLLAGLFHETHTFLEGRTTLDDFQVRSGEELWTAENDGSPLAAALEIARAGQWEILPAIDLRATPGPTVEDRVVERFWGAVEETLNREAARGLDGVCLILHGAMVSESFTDVEGEILSRLRGKIGSNVPVCGVLDLHGNITAKLAENSHGLIAYRQNPHADAFAASRDGAVLLDRLITSGKRPVTVWEHPPVMWPPTGTGTAFDPMKSLEAMAREIERTHPEILAVNVFGGFSFADTPDTGVSFTAVTLGDPEAARLELKRLSEWTVQHREIGNVLEEPLEPILQRIVEKQTGDGTALLKALIAHKIQNAAVALNDPQAVAAQSELRAGEKITLDLGGRGSPLSGGPLRLEVEFVSRSDGHFKLEDPNSHLASMCGTYVEMGPCAVVRHAGISILLTSRKTPPFDLGQWRSQGIVPEKLAVIGVKAAVAHRRVYEPIMSEHYTVETPGPCSSNVKLFPFKKVKRPVYPLDEI